MPDLQTQTTGLPLINSRKRAIGWLLAAMLIVVLDLWTKSLASESLSLYRPVEVTSWLNMTLAHNYGAAFSFLSDAGGWQRWLFTILAAVVTVVLIVWLFRLQPKEKLTAAALGMIIGGALGNLIDRIVNGELEGRVSSGVRLFLGEKLILPTASGTFTASAGLFLTNNVTVVIPEGMHFVASKNGKKYYPVTSSAGNRLTPKNRLYFRTSEEAEAAGYVK